MDHIWHWGGGECYFDVTEKVCIERITRALEDMKSNSDGFDEAVRTAGDGAARHCEMIGAFFATVLGEEAAHEICGVGAGAEACSAAYVDFILFVRDEVESLARIRSSLEEKLEEISK